MHVQAKDTLDEGRHQHVWNNRLKKQEEASKRRVRCGDKLTCCLFASHIRVRVNAALLFWPRWACTLTQMKTEARNVHLAWQRETKDHRQKEAQKRRDQLQAERENAKFQRDATEAQERDLKQQRLRLRKAQLQEQRQRRRSQAEAARQETEQRYRAHKASSELSVSEAEHRRRVEECEARAEKQEYYRALRKAREDEQAAKREAQR